MKYPFVLAFLFSILLLSSTAVGQVNILSRDVFVNACDLTFYGSADCDMQFFSDLGEGTFNATATATTGTGSVISTSQNSSVTSSFFSVEASTDPGVTTEFSTESITSLLVEFEVLIPTNYVLDATFIGPSTFVDLSFGSSPEDNVFRIPSDLDGQTDVLDTGVLLPDVYTFDFSVVGIGDTNAPGATSSANLSLTFETVAVPEPSSCVLLGVLVSALAIRRKKTR